MSNKVEIDNDGTRIGTPKELMEHFVPLVKTQDYQEFEVAKEGRALLLNTFEHASERHSVLESENYLLLHL